MTSAPLTPPECDLRDFPFMPLDVVRLRDSDLAANETPEACWAAVLLWAASWHQVPAASMPDDERWIAKAAGYLSRGKIDKAWPEIHHGAMRGFILCTDGRWHHPVVAEKAREAWMGKLKQRWMTECARIKKYNQRNRTDIQVPDFEDWLSLGCPQGQRPNVPRDSDQMSPWTRSPCPQDVPRETHSKGQGEGQGQINTNTQADAKSTSPGDGAENGTFAPTLAGQVGMALKAAGVDMAQVNLSDTRLLSLLQQGADIAEFAGLAQEAVSKGIARPWPWILKVLPERRREAHALSLAPKAERQESERERKAREDAAEVAGVYAPFTVKPAPGQAQAAPIHPDDEVISGIGPSPSIAIGHG